MDRIIVEIKCPFCGATHTVEVFEADFVAWQDGALAQNVFPYLSATEREQLVSHICPNCQDSIFGSDEDKLEDYEEPEDIDSDFGFDPYCGCYTYDCQQVSKKVEKKS